jgi:hypothetical protein
LSGHEVKLYGTMAQTLPEIIRIRRVRVSDVLQRKAVSNQEWRSSKDCVSFESFHDGFEPPQIGAQAIGQLNSRLSNAYHGALESRKSCDSTLALHQTDKTMIRTVKSPQTEPVRIVENGSVSTQGANEDWFKILTEAVDTLAAIQIVDCGEEREED